MALTRLAREYAVTQGMPIEIEERFWRNPWRTGRMPLCLRQAAPTPLRDFSSSQFAITTGKSHYVDSTIGVHFENVAAWPIGVPIESVTVQMVAFSTQNRFPVRVIRTLR